MRPLFQNWLVAVMFALTIGYAAPPERVAAHNGPAGVLAGEQLRDSRRASEGTATEPYATGRSGQFLLIAIELNTRRIPVRLYSSVRRLFCSNEFKQYPVT